VTDKTTKDYYTGKNKKVYLQKIGKDVTRPNACR
jgi:hypothetical protein